MSQEGIAAGAQDRPRGLSRQRHCHGAAAGIVQHAGGPDGSGRGGAVWRPRRLAAAGGEPEDHRSDAAAETTLRAVISWARFGEAFAYDEDSGVRSLDNPSRGGSLL